MQVSGNSSSQGVGHVKKKQQPKKNENQQPPIQLHNPHNSQPTQGLNNKLNITA